LRLLFKNINKEKRIITLKKEREAADEKLGEVFHTKENINAAEKAALIAESRAECDIHAAALCKALQEEYIKHEIEAKRADSGDKIRLADEAKRKYMELEDKAAKAKNPKKLSAKF
jgi:hypothetical protein